MKGKTVKRIIECEECCGFESLLGETVTLFCLNYIYTGKLTGVNDSHVVLSDAKVVYETGGLCEKEWEDAQSLPHDWMVQISAVEAWGIMK